MCNNLDLDLDPELRNNKRSPSCLFLTHPCVLTADCTPSRYLYLTDFSLTSLPLACPTHAHALCVGRALLLLVLLAPGMSRDQLVLAKEESTEFGGYFICNGIERIIRMLILQVCIGISLTRRAA